MYAVLLAMLNPFQTFCADGVCYEVNDYCSPVTNVCHYEMDTYSVDDTELEDCETFVTPAGVPVLFCATAEVLP